MTDKGNVSVFSLDSNNTTTSQDIVFATLYAFIVLPGVVGNAIVIIIVRKTPSMHTTTNYLLMNLAVADLLTLLFCPGLYDFALTKVRLHGTLGDFICKLFAGNVVVPITINAAVLTVCTIAVERYLALVKPFRIRLRLTKESVGYVVAVLWFLALLSCIPDILTNTYDTASSKYPCKRPWSLDEYSSNKPFIIFTGVCFGLLCALILFICYFEIIRGLYFTKTICAGTATITRAEKRSKRQLAQLLIWLTVVFFFCALPFNVYFTFLVFADPKTVQDNYETLHLLHRVSRFLLFSNSFCNPLLYAMQSSNYQDRFKSICSFRLTLNCVRRLFNSSVSFTPNAGISTSKQNTNGVCLEDGQVELRNIEKKGSFVCVIIKNLAPCDKAKCNFWHENGKELTPPQ